MDEGETKKRISNHHLTQVLEKLKGFIYILIFYLPHLVASTPSELIYLCIFLYIKRQINRPMPSVAWAYSHKESGLGLILHTHTRALEREKNTEHEEPLTAILPVAHVKTL